MSECLVLQRTPNPRVHDHFASLSAWCIHYTTTRAQLPQPHSRDLTTPDIHDFTATIPLQSTAYP